VPESEGPVVVACDTALGHHEGGDPPEAQRSVEQGGRITELSPHEVRVAKLGRREHFDRAIATRWFLSNSSSHWRRMYNPALPFATWPAKARPDDAGLGGETALALDLSF
jgi:hypothetical protein